MESFFLSETAKYLYLLHSNATTLPDFYVFSTEGHLLPVLPFEGSAAGESSGQAPKHANCRGLCCNRSQEDLSQAGTPQYSIQGLHCKLCLHRIAVTPLLLCTAHFMRQNACDTLVLIGLQHTWWESCACLSSDREFHSSWPFIAAERP